MPAVSAGWWGERPREPSRQPPRPTAERSVFDMVSRPQGAGSYTAFDWRETNRFVKDVGVVTSVSHRPIITRPGPGRSSENCPFGFSSGPGSRRAHRQVAGQLPFSAGWPTAACRSYSSSDGNFISARFAYAR